MKQGCNPDWADKPAKEKEAPPPLHIAPNEGKTEVICS